MSRVVLVGKGPPEQGGIPSFLQLLLQGSTGGPHDVELLNLARSGRTAGGRFSLRNARRTAQDAWRLWCAARNRDIVHLHTAMAPTSTMLRAGLLSATGRIRGASVIVHVHGGLLQSWLSTPLRRWLTRLALTPAQQVVAVSAGGRDTLIDLIGAQRVRLIDNGVRPDDYGPAGPGSSPPRILYAGLLSPRKGVVDLLQASATLRERGIDHELVLVGGNDQESDEAEAAVRRALTPDARLLGPQPHASMPDIYRSADVFCLPSWWEAMPLSVLEAMASGLPVVASTVGDIPRLVEDGATGRLVPPKAPQALADALAEVLADPGRGRLMGKAGRRRVEQHFSADTTLAAVHDLYSAASRRGDGEDAVMTAPLAHGEAGAVRIEMIESPGVCADWEALAERVAASPFMRPWWITEWTRSFNAGSLVLITVRRGTTLVGLLPMVRHRGALRSPANWHSCVFGILAEDAAAADAIAEACMALPVRAVDVGFLKEEDAERFAAAARRRGRRVIHRVVGESPHIHIEGDWASYEQSLSRNWRQVTRRRSRRLNDQGEVVIQSVRGLDGLPEALEEAFRVEASGWKGQAGTAIASKPATRSFYRGLARTAARQGCLRLDLMRLDGKPVAMVFGLEQGGHYHMLKTGYDETLGRFSPGHVLFRELLQDMFARDTRSADLAAGKEAWKRKWTDRVVRQHRVQAFRPTIGGMVEWAAWQYGRPMVKWAQRTVVARLRPDPGRGPQEID